MKEITRITVDGSKAICPHCRRGFKLRDKYFLPRHGFSFERSGQYPQHERGNCQYGECRGSGMKAPQDIVDSRIYFAQQPQVKTAEGSGS